MILLYWHTLRYLKPIQFVGRIFQWIYRPKPDLKPAPEVRPANEIWIAPQWRKSETLSVNTFTFLNRRRDLVFPRDWNSPEIEKLWLYNLHYFNDLTGSSAAKHKSRHKRMMNEWILGNPPAKGIGWDPYPLSLRIVNWIKWALAGNCLDNKALHSLAVQVRHLKKRLEIHLLGNHLFENAKALVFAGLFFRGAEADEWYKIGTRILVRQLREQILPDGGHFERSPMYHAIILEGLLDVIHLHKAFGLTPPSSWSKTATKMLSWLKTMSHPDGDVSFFNDTTLGNAPTLHDLVNYSVTNGVAQPEALKGSFLLKSSGFARLVADRAELIADVGSVGPDYLPGHAHAATLSFELSLDGERVIVNTGISTYEPGPDRIWQRGTAAHSTLMVDGQNSSVVWSGFRVAQRARATVRFFKQGAQSSLSASHDGYRRLIGRPIHIRTWQLGENSLEITDEIGGAKEHSIVIIFHFHPNFNINLSDDGSAVISDGLDRDVNIDLDPRLSWRINPEKWHPGFGLSMENYSLQGTSFTSLPENVVTRFSWCQP